MKIKVKAIDNMVANGARAVKIKLLADPASTYLVGPKSKAVIQILDNE